MHFFLKNRFFLLFILVSLAALPACSHVVAKREVASKDGKPDKSPGKGGVTEPVTGPVLNAWVEMNPGGGGIARAITTDSACPSATINGVAIDMQVRATASSDGSFPNLVCELNVPTSAKVSIAGATMPGVPASPQRILVIGDTGCVVKDSASGGKSKIQDCDSSSGWPFADIAAAAAAQKPDLVIHVGDYHYRESACPAGNSGCDGSIYGDVWASWNEDFFIPAKPLLAAAPWVFVRGNHEICQRAHQGYFRLLDPHPFINGSCLDTIPPYSLKLDSINLAVLDSSVSDITPAMMLAVASLPVQGAWLVTHRPPWVSSATQAAGDGDEDVGPEHGSPPPSAGVPSNLSLVVTGHQHLFRTATFADHRPPQIISGNGGTLLEHHPVADTVGTAVDSGSTTLSSVNTLDQFGFLVFQKTGSGQWSAQEFGLDGNPSVTCSLTSNGSPAALECK